MHSNGSIQEAKDLNAVPCDWGFQHDCHVIDWRLWRAMNGFIRRCRELPKTDIDFRFDPDDWTRYDGELL